ncbi:MAG TPA: hypothetical protein VLI39_18105 [Sedimentisphaerales bacterium]|nr:hypothetical protein [Sedimentisphaerales bacterium]
MRAGPVRVSDDGRGFVTTTGVRFTPWGFYWGKIPEEYRGSGALSDALTLAWLELFEKRGRP